MKSVISAFLFLFLVITISAAEEGGLKSAAHGKPNIVIFLADDLGWADVGWHGTEIKTPNLDKLASQGVKFEQFYVLPLCTPTRAALMTGRYPIRYGLQSGVIFFWGDYGLSTEERTLAQALHDTGYYTAITGKWHLGQSEKKYLPNQRGFDYHYGFYHGMIDYYEHTARGGLDWHRNGKTVREPGYSTKLIGDDAVKVIENHDTSKPLFLYVPFNAVHSPFQEIPNKKLKEQYEGLEGDRKIYAGMVSSMDSNIGRIYNALEKKGIADNTVIFFSSDNGGPFPKKVTDNGNLRAGKGTLFDGGVRVPAFAVWKGKIKPGTVSNELIHITDLYPTILNIAGSSAEQKLPLDGVDIKEVLTDNKPTARKEILINAESQSGALRQGDWKIIALNLDKQKGDKIKYLLYNLKDDPGETTDLSAQEPEKLKELLQRYEKYASESVPALLKPRPADFNVPDVWSEFD